MCPWIFFCFTDNIFADSARKKKKGTKCFWKGRRVVRRMKVGQGIFCVQLNVLPQPTFCICGKGKLANFNWWKVRMFACLVSGLSPRRQLHPLWPKTGQISGQTPFEDVAFTFGVCQRCHVLVDNELGPAKTKRSKTNRLSLLPKPIFVWKWSRTLPI